MTPLVGHDDLALLGTVPVRLLLGAINLHGILIHGVAPLALLLVVQLVLALPLNVHAPVVRVLVVSPGARIAFGVSHVSVVAHVGVLAVVTLAFTLVELGFVGTVVVVVGGEISLGLLGWELGRGRRFGVPVTEQLATEPHKRDCRVVSTRLTT